MDDDADADDGGGQGEGGKRGKQAERRSLCVRMPPGLKASSVITKYSFCSSVT